MSRPFSCTVFFGYAAIFGKFCSIYLISFTFYFAYAITVFFVKWVQPGLKLEKSWLNKYSM